MADRGSLTERLRAQRAKSLGPKSMTLDVPGWDGMLQIRYKPIPDDDLVKILDGVSTDNAKAMVQGNVDLLIAACDTLLVVDEGEAVPLGDILKEQGEEVHGGVRFDAYASSALGLETEGARDTVRAVFGGAVSPTFAINEHAAKLVSWMSSSSQDADKALAGK